jgi:hypothetical protein
MPKLTPQQAREKHANRLKASSADIRAGIERVSVAPGQQAAAKADKMRQNIVASIESGKWQKRVASISLEEWKRQATDKGIGRIAAGVDGAAAKIEAFYAELFPYQEQLQNKISKLPDLTLEDSINRMTTFVRGMAEFKRR